MYSNNEFIKEIAFGAKHQRLLSGKFAPNCVSKINLLQIWALCQSLVCHAPYAIKKLLKCLGHGGIPRQQKTVPAEKIIPREKQTNNNKCVIIKYK